MLSNYLKITLRSLLKNPVFSFINIAGLSTGLACSMLIILWVWDEMSFNKYFPKYDNLYQVRLNATVDKGIVSGVALPYALKDAITLQDGRIKRAAMTNWGEGALLARGDKKLNNIGLWVSESFLEMFQFQMIHGNSHSLDDPRSIVLTASMATSLFGKEDPMNKMVLFENKEELKVTGVIADPPQNTNFSPFNFYIPYAYYELSQSWVRQVKDKWDNNVAQVYLELEPGTNYEEVNASIHGLITEKNKTLDIFPLRRE